jgi:quercetin dioxygenase-like cupin family protein
MTSKLRGYTYSAEVLLIICMLSLGLVVDAQSVVVSPGVGRTLVTSTSIPNDPTQTLTSVVVELPPGARSPSHHYAGTVLVCVLAGTVRS